VNKTKTKLSENVRNGVHCVVVPKKQEKRTAKVLQAVALGIPVVSEDWFTQSIKKETPLNVSDFKCSRFFSASDIVRKQLESHDDLLFANKSFVLSIISNPDETNLLKFVITHLGGKIIQSKQNCDYLVSDSTKTTTGDGVDSKITLVKPKFVLDSVEKQTIQNINDY
jgi:hypothetical protein